MKADDNDGMPVELPEAPDEDLIRVTSDWHLGHLRIPEFSGRPFAGTEEGMAHMAEMLLARWNLGRWGGEHPGYALGDMVMGHIASTLPLLRRMTGPVCLIAGNHDRCHPCNHRTQRELRAALWRDRYLEEGGLAWTGLELGLAWRGVSARMSHFPYRGGGDHSEAERFSSWRLEDDGGWLLCGHVHEAWRQRGRMINVGVDAWGGWPVSLGEVRELVEAGPRDLDVLPWDREPPAWASRMTEEEKEEKAG
jgi:calcineurin-like phosphoesterase family protein